MTYSLLSIVTGTDVCNARCPFCISKMTPPQGVSKLMVPIDWRNFHIAARLAQQGGAGTVMITGKGEPALYPEAITEILENLSGYNFPLLELQTNGILFVERADKYSEYLKQWYERELSIIAISMVHFKAEKNREVYTPHRPEYPSLERMIDTLHQRGFTVRLACILAQGYIDNPESFEQLINFCKKHGVEQLAARPVNMPESSRNQVAAEWVKQHRLSTQALDSISSFVQSRGTRLLRYPHGAEVYDFEGQNVCLTNSLTAPAAQSEVRQLIFFPDGTIAYDWQYEGAIILRGRAGTRSSTRQRREQEETLRVVGGNIQ